MYSMDLIHICNSSSFMGEDGAMSATMLPGRIGEKLEFNDALVK